MTSLLSKVAKLQTLPHILLTAVANLKQPRPQLLTAHTALASKLGQWGFFFKVDGYSLSVLMAFSQQLQNEKMKPKKSFLTTKKSPSVAEPMFSIVARFLRKNRRFFQKIAW